MGDVRFARQLELLRASGASAGVLHGMSDEELAECLAAADPGADPYLVNVLATELSNRLSRKRTVLESLPDGVVLFDAEGRVAYANRALGSIIDLPNTSSLTLQSDHPVTRLARRSVASGRRVDGVEITLGLAQSATRVLSITTRLIDDGTRDSPVLVVVQDVTERRATEERIRRMRLDEIDRRYRALFAASPARLDERERSHERKVPEP